MTGSSSGQAGPSGTGQQQQSTTGGTWYPSPTQQQTNNAYNQYGLHHYHNNVQNLNQVNQSAAQADQSKYGPLFSPVLNLINGPGEVGNQLGTTAKNLKQGLDIRNAPGSVNPNYVGIPHAELYKSVTQGVDPASVTSVSDTWLNIGNK